MSKYSKPGNLIEKSIALFIEPNPKFIPFLELDLLVFLFMKERLKSSTVLSNQVI